MAIWAFLDATLFEGHLNTDTYLLLKMSNLFPAKKKQVVLVLENVENIPYPKDFRHGD